MHYGHIFVIQSSNQKKKHLNLKLNHASVHQSQILLNLVNCSAHKRQHSKNAPWWANFRRGLVSFTPSGKQRALSWSTSRAWRPRSSQWKKDWVSQERDPNVPAEPSGSVQHITIVSFFRWLFWLFPMVTPYSTTTAMLNRALREERDANVEPRELYYRALLPSVNSSAPYKSSILTKRRSMSRPNGETHQTN